MVGLNQRGSIESQISVDIDKEERKSVPPEPPMRKGTFLRKKYSKVSLRAGGIMDHFDNDREDEEQKSPIVSEILKNSSSKNFMKNSVLLVSLYNIIFIPLQFAYRIDFEGILLILEVFTVIIYCFDVFYRVKSLRILNNPKGFDTKDNHTSENGLEQSLMDDDKDTYVRRNRMLKIEMISSVVAALPFSFVF